MNFLNSAARTGGVAVTSSPSLHVRAALSDLSMYRDRPTGEISLEEFESYALDRLRVLKGIEEAKLRGRSDEAVQSEAAALMKKHMQCSSSRVEAARKDAVSHYILRLAYCRTPELRAWLLTHEAALFRARFRELDRQQQVDFFSSVALPYRAISEEEAEALTPLLAAVAASSGDRDKATALLKQAAHLPGGGSRPDVAPSPDIGRGATGAGRPSFFEVPFAAVPDLVGRRQVLLRAGYAYVGEDQVHSLVLGAFRASLSAALAEAARAWGEFVAGEASRLAPLVDSLPNRSVSGSGEARRLPGGELSAAALPRLLADRQLPLCMSVMMERLASESHLKHWGLQQLSLFLKAIGLPMEQALLFFRQQFAPRTSGEKFARQYAYSLRYNYGQEGKREDWSEYSCVRIINQEVGGACSAPGECNGGCPYKTLDAAQLSVVLSRMGCSDRVTRDVVDKARGKHYQLACGLAYEGIHGSPQEAGINRPSDYYAASVELATQRAAAAGGAVPESAQPTGQPPATPAPAPSSGAA